MSLKIMLTADVHLGKKFANYPPDIQEDLINARFETLKNIVRKANEKTCDMLVVSGDLFDRINTVEKDIIKAADIIQEFEGNLTLVLPGNHDYFTDNTNKPWSVFSDHCGDRTLILGQAGLYNLSNFDIDANIYAGPCNSKHSEKNNLGWISEKEKDLSVNYHIGVAHGSLEGVSPDSDSKYFPMTLDELEDFGLDLWLLGHTDRLYYPEIAGKLSRIFFPGTPEPNAFNCSHEGNVWLIELNDEKEVSTELIKVGTFKFIYDEHTLNDEDDLIKLISKYTDNNYKNSLCKIKLYGKVEEELFSQIGDAENTIRKHCKYLVIDTEQLKRKISMEVVNKEFAEHSFPYRLLESLESSEDSFEFAYDLIKEVQNEN